jgi:uncharacterized protein YegP (UPF0339 family)
MAKKKLPFIRINDAKGGFRTQLVGGNGEPLMTSEVIETVAAVKKNLVAVLHSTRFTSAVTLFTDKEVENRLFMKREVVEDNYRIEYTGTDPKMKKLLGMK